MKTIKTVLILLTFSLFAACVDNDYDIGNVNTEMVLDGYSLVSPIGKVNVNIEDLLKEFKIDNLYVEGNSLYFGYQDTLSISALDVVSIDADAVQRQARFGAAVGTQIKAEEKFRLNIYSKKPNTRIDSIRLKESVLKIIVNSALSSSAELTISFPNSNLQTTPASAKFTVSPGDNNLSLQISDKSAITISTDELGGYFDVHFTLETADVAMLTPGAILLDFSFESFDYDVMWGFFPEVTEEGVKGEYELDFFKEILPDGSVVYLTNPSIACNVSNYNGIGRKLTVDLKAYDKDGSTVTSDFDGSSSADILLRSATVPYQSVTTSATFDNNYGKINKFFHTNLKKIEFNAVIDPITVGNNKQFLLKDKNLDIVLDLKLPLSFDKGSILLIKDTLDLALDSLLPDEIKPEELVLRLDYETRLPVKAKLGVIFLNKDQNPISAIKPQLYQLNSATVDNDGFTTRETKGLIPIKFGGAELSSVPNVKYMILTAEITGATPDSRASFSTKDYIRVKADIFAKGSFMLNKK